MTSSNKEIAVQELNSYKVDCTKRYIAHIESLMRSTKAAAFELEQLKARCEPGAIAYDNIAVQTSTTGDSLERAVLDLVEFRDQLEREQQLGLAQINAFAERLSKLKSEGGVIVRLHYRDKTNPEQITLNGASYPEIGVPLGYSRRTAFRKRDEGYRELYDNGIPDEFAPKHSAI